MTQTRKTSEMAAREAELEAKGYQAWVKVRGEYTQPVAVQTSYLIMSEKTAYNVSIHLYRYLCYSTSLPSPPPPPFIISNSHTTHAHTLTHAHTGP
jgi:hypothetical protein